MDVLYEYCRLYGSPSEEKTEGVKILKYVVWKVEDVLAVCNENGLATLESVGRMISEMRKEQGKTANATYYVVNTDEPYADKVKALIEEHEGEEVTFD